MKKTTAARLIIATTIFMLVANYLVFAAHQYAHAATAKLLTYKAYFIQFLQLFKKHGYADFTSISSIAQLHDRAIIAIAAFGLTYTGIYLLTLLLMKRRIAQRVPMIFYFIFWLNFMSLARVFSYIPVRIFSEGGDIADIIQGFNISPWWIFVFGGYAITYMIWHFFNNTLVRTYDVLQLKSNRAKAALMLLCAIPLFVFYGTTGFYGNNEISHFLSAASLLLLPGVIAACWPLSHRQTLTNVITETINATIQRQEPTLTEELALPHSSIDEAHFIENLNAALDQRDAKIRESQKSIKSKLSKKRK